MCLKKKMAHVISKHKQSIPKIGYSKDMTGGSRWATEKDGNPQLEMTCCLLTKRHRMTNIKRYPDYAFKLRVYFL